MQDLEKAALAALIGEAYRRTGVTLDESKHTMISSRLRRRCRAVGANNLREYWSLLRKLDDTADEVARFVHSMTTHKTFLFRTTSVWEALAEEFTRRAREGASMDVWSVACSTGQEPASIAILADSICNREGGGKWSVQASDVSPVVVEEAAEARFPVEQIEQAIQSQKAVPVDSYFEPESMGTRQLIASVRKRIRYLPWNLFDRSSRLFDVVFIRNVIIYFSPEDKLRALENATRALREGGLLIIGESESLTGRLNGLEYVAPWLYRKSR